MISLIRKELIIYTVLLVVLTFVMHPDMLSDPAARFEIMKNRANFAHPLLYTGVLYVVSVIVRLIAKLVMKFFKKS